MQDQIISLEDISSIEHLELLAKQVVEGFIIGLHKSPFHGFSVEFAEHRLYNPGASTKNIDWKVFARTDKLFVKQYEEETNLRCQIIIDTSSSMYFPNQTQNKLRFSSVCAAAIMHLLKKQRDAAGISLFDETLQVHTEAKSSTKHHNAIYAHLNRLIEDTTPNKKTSTAQALHQVADQIHKRSLVVVFTDLLDTTGSDELFSALQHLKYNKHEVILFHVVDQKLEVDFEFENRPYLFVDMESGEEIKLHANEVKAQYKKQQQAHIESMKAQCIQHKIDFVEADIRQPFRNVLLPYLVKRQKMN